jgi:hypothetical protein
MIDIFSKLSKEQRRLIEDRLTNLTEFVSLCRQFPDGDMPAEVSTACRESADFAAFMIIDLCAILSGMTNAQRSFLREAYNAGLSFKEVFEDLEGVLFAPEADAAEA